MKHMPDEHAAAANAGGYHILIDHDNKTVPNSNITGQEILALVGKTSSDYLLYQKKQGTTSVVDAEQMVDLTEPGIERFQTLKREATEG